jgi:hypothetical protein
MVIIWMFQLLIIVLVTKRGDGSGWTKKGVTKRGDRRKRHFGKHDKSLTSLWSPSYRPQFGVAKCHFRLEDVKKSILKFAANSA